MKDTVQILTEARNLIVNGRWTQGAYAKNTPEGGLQSAFNFQPEQLPPGVCFCATGAIGYVQKDYPMEDQPTIQALAIAIGLPENFDPSMDSYECIITSWNDEKTRTREEVVAMFDKAIVNVSA